MSNRVHVTVQVEINLISRSLNIRLSSETALRKTYPNAARLERAAGRGPEIYNQSTASDLEVVKLQKKNPH